MKRISDEIKAKGCLKSLFYNNDFIIIMFFFQLRDVSHIKKDTQKEHQTSQSFKTDMLFVRFFHNININFMDACY